MILNKHPCLSAGDSLSQTSAAAQLSAPACGSSPGVAWLFATFCKSGGRGPGCRVALGP